MKTTGRKVESIRYLSKMYREVFKWVHDKRRNKRWWHNVVHDDEVTSQSQSIAIQQYALCRVNSSLPSSSLFVQSLSHIQCHPMASFLSHLNDGSWSRTQRVRIHTHTRPTYMFHVRLHIAPKTTTTTTTQRFYGEKQKFLLNKTSSLVLMTFN